MCYELAASLKHLVQSAIRRLLLVFEAHGLPMAGGINEGLVDAAVVTYWMPLGCDTRWTFDWPCAQPQGPRCFRGAPLSDTGARGVSWTPGLQSQLFSHTFNLLHLGQ